MAWQPRIEPCIDHEVRARGAGEIRAVDERHVLEGRKSRDADRRREIALDSDRGPSSVVRLVEERVPAADQHSRRYDPRDWRLPRKPLLELDTRLLLRPPRQRNGRT